MHILTCFYPSSRPDELSWYEFFKDWYDGFGRYSHIYKKIRRAWDQIENFMKEKYRPVYDSLQGLHYR